MADSYHLNLIVLHLSEKVKEFNVSTYLQNPPSFAKALELSPEQQCEVTESVDFARTSANHGRLLKKSKVVALLGFEPRLYGF